MNAMAQVPNKKTVRGACPQDCPDTCAFLYDVADGKLVGVRGDPDHPYTRGRLCTKLNDFAAHHYNPDRILYPMKRVGPKGAGQFERISWKEALTTVRDRWTGIIENDGPQAIMPCSYIGHEGLINGLTVGDAFFNRLGSTIAEKTFCGVGAAVGWELTLGHSPGVDPESFVHARYIILWAVNMLSTNIHHWPFVEEARQRGAKVVVIDPYRSRTAAQADWHVAIKPGTDAALALGMMNVIIEEGLVDRDYVENYTVGYDELKERAVEYPPERVAEITGLPADDLRRLAREYATTSPAVIRLGVAIERHRNGGQAARAVNCLPALIGAWRHVGGGALDHPLWAFPFKFDAIQRPDWIRPGTRVINCNGLGKALTELDPPLKSMLVYNVNPVVQAPQQDLIRKGLMREDMFLVVSELFVTDTAKYADILLPACMQAEQVDLMFAWGQFYWTYNHRAIDPPGETVSNTELFRRLAKVMGFTEEEFTRTDEEMIRAFVDWTAPSMQGITLEALQEKGYMHLTIGDKDTSKPHAEGNFPTPSGKCEFKSSRAAAGNFVPPPFRAGSNEFQDGGYIDPLPSYTPMFESAENDPELASRYSLNIISPKAHSFLNSQYANEPRHEKRQGPQEVLINPSDAVARGIAAGDWIRVFNDRGAFHGKAKLTDETMPGVVIAYLGYWTSRSRGDSAVNAISSDRTANMGRAPTYSDNLVEVERSAFMEAAE